jgi:serine-type D-Ala-D-Ala carboxypeptidase/endopeptidase (penicillin-binding protein 4)
MLRRAILGIALFLFVAPASPVLALDLLEFQDKMKKHIANLSSKTTAAVRMEVMGSGLPIFSHNENRKMIPASDAKLITVMAALEKLGPGFTFETKVFQEGEDLVIAGNGDPYLVSERLWLLARSVARLGIGKIRSIKVNNSAFAQTYAGLREFEGSGEPFTALVSASALNFNSVEIHVVPGNGSKAKLEAGPFQNPYAILKNEVQVNGGSGKSITVKALGAEGNRQTFLVSGSIGRRAAPVVVYAAVSMPEAHLASAFAALLRKEGVAVANDYGGLAINPIPASREPLASLESLPLQDLVRLINNYSNNFMTEEIFLALSADPGKAASMSRSKEVVGEYLRRHEACAESSLENGSGLHWETRVSARCFTETIQDAYREFLSFADLLGSLPAGGSTGTLKSRFKRNGSSFQPLKVRGKTGTLWSKQVVTSLAGVTATGTGEKVVFSLIENDQRNDPALLRELKEWEDKCLELVQQLRL